MHRSLTYSYTSEREYSYKPHGHEPIDPVHKIVATKVLFDVHTFKIPVWGSCGKKVKAVIFNFVDTCTSQVSLSSLMPGVQPIK